jgi:hypothetical protein
MPAYSTKTADLLDDIKAAIKTEVTTSGTLSSVKQVRIGPVTNPAAFPFISIVPIDERNNGIRNGIMINVRQIRIEVYASKAKSKDSMRAAMGMIEKVKDIFVTNSDYWQIPSSTIPFDPTVFDLQITSIGASDKPVPYRNGFIHQASLEMACWSKDEFSPDITTSYDIYNMAVCDAKTLIDSIAIVFKKYKTGANDILSNTKSFRSFTMPPSATFPTIFIGIEAENREHAIAGKDVIERDISINILTQMGSREENLRRNLKIADYCRQILLANTTFQGKVVHYDYDGITFGQLVGDRGQLLYGSSLSFTTQNFETLPN